MATQDCVRRSFFAEQLDRVAIPIRLIRELLAATNAISNTSVSISIAPGLFQQFLMQELWGQVRIVVPTDSV